VSPALSRRLGAALGLKPVTPAERSRVLRARRAEDWGDLPASVQKLVLDIEGRPDVTAGQVQAAAGMDTHPGGEELKHYWLHGEGAAKWSTWTELYHHLLKYLSPGMAKRTAAEWFHERYGDWPGSDTNKVRHGKPPRGHLVGPG
jgi:hypothetical protein